MARVCTTDMIWFTFFIDHFDPQIIGKISNHHVLLAWIISLYIFLKVLNSINKLIISTSIVLTFTQ